MSEALRELVHGWRSAKGADPIDLAALGAALSVAVVRVVAMRLASVAMPESPALRFGDGPRVASSWRELLDAFDTARDVFGSNALFAPSLDAVLERGTVDAPSLARSFDEIERFVRGSPPAERLDPLALGSAFEHLLGWEIVREGDALTLRLGESRRRMGAHYTSPALADVVVERALAPLLARSGSAADVLELRVCDPSMGAGAFLLAAADRLTAHALSCERAEPRGMRAQVVASCLHGVDKNPLAVAAARLGLWLAVGDPALGVDAFDEHLRVGDAILHTGETDAPGFDWRGELAPIFTPPRGGFDAIVGNPPWVSYAGRAAQPMPDELRRAHGTNVAFGGYRNLQSLFVQRGASLLRPGGRLGFVLPTSMSDLSGYEPSRRAHDALAIADAELPDFGDSFEGVFQPCMALLSTKRDAPVEVARAGPWPLARTDLDAPTRALLGKLDALPKLAPETFGERGFQTNRGDVARLRELERADDVFTVALRTGTEIAPFQRKAPTLFANPGDFGGRIRARDAWRAVHLLIRQTARYPMVALSDGLAFRNSVLAGFASDVWSAQFLVAYLNASPIRFYHYMRHRDARQGMPQLKIGHLRALPAPSESRATREIERVGRELGERNTGIGADERADLDRLVADALDLTQSERERVAAWASATKG